MCAKNPCHFDRDFLKIFELEGKNCVKKNPEKIAAINF